MKYNIDELRKMKEVVMNKLYTIGFTQKKAELFFNILIKHNVKKVIDVRLNNNSQLAAFTKQDDLQFFLKTIGNIDYSHQIILAPTEELLHDYKKKKIDWNQYEKSFENILNNRHPERVLSINDLSDACLLCSEPLADKCHRRLVAEYFKRVYPDISIIHL